MADFNTQGMTSIKDLVRRVIALHACGMEMTLLTVCPNSDAVLEAAIKVAAASNMPMLFAATLNQVDRDGGYTALGWRAVGLLATHLTGFSSPQHIRGYFLRYVLLQDQDHAFDVRTVCLNGN